MSIQKGDRVHWAVEKPDAKAPVKRRELFRVQKVYGNGRCDLIDSNGAELFNIPTTHLQRLDIEVPLRQRE